MIRLRDPSLSNSLYAVRSFTYKFFRQCNSLKLWSDFTALFYSWSGKTLMSPGLTEHAPLISHAAPLLDETQGARNGDRKVVVPRRGPLEITRPTRYGILAGIWTATFLSVC